MKYETLEWIDWTDCQGQFSIFRINTENGLLVGQKGLLYILITK